MAEDADQQPDGSACGGYWPPWSIARGIMTSRNSATRSPISNGRSGTPGNPRLVGNFASQQNTRQAVSLGRSVRTMSN